MEENENIIKDNSGITELKPKTETKTELKPDDWLCIVCNKKITSDKNRFEINNESEFQFVNPAGLYFDIITFIEAEGCRITGEPIIEYTWFPGHTWQLAVCSRCSTQLGWKYEGRYSFYGLIKARLVKGNVLFN